VVNDTVAELPRAARRPGGPDVGSMYVTPRGPAHSKLRALAFTGGLGSGWKTGTLARLGCCRERLRFGFAYLRESVTTVSNAGFPPSISYRFRR
jgi:hypothetical protein